MYNQRLSVLRLQNIRATKACLFSKNNPFNRCCAIATTSQRFTNTSDIIRRLPLSTLSSNILAADINGLNLGQIRSLHTSLVRFAEKDDGGGDKGKEDDKERKEKDEMKELEKKLWSYSLFITFAFAVSFFAILIGASDTNHSESVEISWNEFVHQLLSKGEVHRIEIQTGATKHGSQETSSDIAIIYPYKDAVIDNKPVLHHNPLGFYRMTLQNVQKFEVQLRKAEEELGIPPSGRVPVIYRNTDTQRAFAYALGWILFIVMGYLLFRKFRSFAGKMPNPFESMTKARYQLVDPHSMEANTPKIKFKDVAGLHEAKVEIQEFVDYLKRPTAYTKLGAKLPKGALLHGPPGCGKTLLAKAVASEASVPFMAINGTDFVEMIGGVGASRVRQLFSEAKKRAPCIIYIDEIDAVGRKRSNAEGAGNSESEQTLNQLLVELDGMDSQQGIVTLCSTNRVDVLDKALMRRGRLDRHITIDVPTLLERKEIFELYLHKIKIDPTVFEKSMSLAQMTPGFTGADINNICNEAAIRTATDSRKLITIADLDWALEKVLAGSQKRTSTLNKEEKEVVAYHESGHALVGWLLKNTDALVKVSIIPRTGAALGFARYSPADRKLFSKEELFDRMSMTLGGRAAENIIFGRITTGAENDLKKVTEIAFGQVRNYGMNEEVGLLSFTPPPGDERQAQFFKKPYSKRLQATIDREALQIVADCYRSTEQLLLENVDKLKLIAQSLLKNEVLTYDDVKRLIGPPTFGDKNVVEVVEQVLPTDLPKEDE